jgi:pimeloyl-ACP methyl ester carboxylesterase
MIAADYYPSNSMKGLIMVHMIGRSKESYRDVADELTPYYKILAIDLRGHGASQGDYEALTEKDFVLMVNDVAGAVTALKGLGVAEKDISIVGSSVGANIALTYASTHTIDKLVLISPGIRYRGVDVERISYRKPVFIQVGHYDAYASISVDQLQANLQEARIMYYDSSAHGTDLIKFDLSAKEDFLFYLS